MTDEYPARLTPSEYRLLKHLATGGEPFVPAIAKANGNHLTYVNVLVQQLKTRGLIKHERYQQMIALTDEGLQLIA